MRIFTGAFLTLIFMANLSLAQSIYLRKVSTLPSLVQETSGIETSNSQFIWTHNDSDGDATLYKIDTFGNLLKSLFIKNVKNSDWEDLTQDGVNYFIGDFGNNSNNRKDLKIYIIQNPDSVKGDSTDAEIISFSYENQNSFPPKNDQLNFDTEAFVYLNHYLYLFTKNRTEPFTGYTYLYKLPSLPGNYTASLIDSFKTGTGFKEQWWITAADLSPDNKKLALLSSDKLFLFTDFEDDNFFKGQNMMVDLGSFTQKEGLVFYTDNDLYITDEYFELFGGRNLYHGNIKDLKNANLGHLKKNRTDLVSFKTQNGESFVAITDELKSINVSLIDLNGKLINQFQLDYSHPIEIIDAPSGYYNLMATDGKVKQVQKIFIE
jgi:hypothetical protein